ncbi:MAG: adenosylcobinamide-GDP ribazoletransferase [bacterium]
MNEFLEALKFLTIVPINRSTDERALAKSPRVFPLVGFFLGLSLSLFLFFFSRITGYWISIMLTILAWEGITGGIHIDGLADTFDGILSRKDRESILEVMRDSRIGTMGALAIFFLLTLKFLSLGEGYNAYTRVIVAPIYGRFLITLSIYLFPYGRKEGKGSIFSNVLTQRDIIFSGAITLVLGLLTGGEKGLLAFFAVIIIGYLIGLYLTRRIGGLTGDMYGAICEITELITLLIL